jgi:pimeloyl-ACP methyl ester carboxylesterase
LRRKKRDAVTVASAQGDVMSRYLLIHGSWHGAWCWFKVAPLLEAHGHVTVPNLPGRGRDPAIPHLVTLQSLVRSVASHLDRNEPTTIVVHSRYGILATALAERYPDSVRRIIYLASFLLPSGERVADYFASDTDSFIGPHVEINRLGAWDRLAPRAYVEGLYADCSREDIALARSLLCREPSLPALTRVKTTPDRFGRVPKAYIRLSRDRAVSPALQDRLIELSRPERVEEMAASHSAYFSQPAALVERIRRLDGR